MKEFALKRWIEASQLLQNSVHPVQEHFEGPEEFCLLHRFIPIQISIRVKQEVSSSAEVISSHAVWKNSGHFVHFLLIHPAADAKLNYPCFSVTLVIFEQGGPVPAI